MKSIPRYPSTKPNKAALIEPSPAARSPPTSVDSGSAQDPLSSADAARLAAESVAVPAVDTSIGRPGAAPVIDGESDPPSPRPLPVPPPAGSSEDADAPRPPI